ncbi:hypothetical protein [Paraburkholderia sp. J10-1]|uniref:hypothetical protein n=1 Tax=Paraburkholderia sp. J10-1 TaxID=2805430 RepID=UPI002AB67F3D|nr:hypothetical protein [Paraburkholderia sp. J10-1]
MSCFADIGWEPCWVGPLPGHLARASEPARSARAPACTGAAILWPLDVASRRCLSDGRLQLALYLGFGAL